MSDCRAEPRNFSTELDYLSNTFLKHMFSMKDYYHSEVAWNIFAQLLRVEKRPKAGPLLSVGTINNFRPTTPLTLKFPEFTYMHTALGLVGLISCHASVGTVEVLRVLALKD